MMKGGIGSRNAVITLSIAVLAVVGVTLSIGGTAEAQSSPPCDTTPIVINTGYDRVSTLLIPPGFLDTYWTVLGPACCGYPSGTNPAPVVVGDPFWNSIPPFFGPLPNSQWISITPAMGSPLLPTPPTLFVYKTTFNLGPGCHKATLNLKAKADDIVATPHNPFVLGGCSSGFEAGVRLNTVPITDPPATFTNNVGGLSVGGIFINPPLEVTLTRPILPILNGNLFFVQGQNVLEIDVTDCAQDVTGLSVEATVTPH